MRAVEVAIARELAILANDYVLHLQQQSSTLRA